MLFLSALLKSQHPTLSSHLECTLGQVGAPYKYLDNTRDLWIRDVMPISLGDNKFVQFSLTQDYYLKKDRYKITDPAPICKVLDIEPHMPLHKKKPIYLDGGNVIRGYGKAIITEKVFDDNDISPDILSGNLKEALQVEKIIFIPVEPKDETGHSDGYVRFVDKSTVVANDYSKIDVAQSFKDRFYGALSGSGLDVLLVPYNPSDERARGYQSASGCYINFLQVGGNIFLPTFDDPANDEAAIARFGAIFGVNNVIPVPSSEIARGGGVLNCLSWAVL